MTSSDETALRPGAFERVAAKVGAARRGRAEVARTARVAVACAEFNGGITERLLDGVLAGLTASGVDAAIVRLVWVPGAFELPLAAQHLLGWSGAGAGVGDRRDGSGGPVGEEAADAVIALGAVIRGNTAHFDFVAGECARGLQRVALDTGRPVVFGVLTTDTVAQALERCRDDETNKGYEAALTALQMIDVLGLVSAPA
ncbi:MAG TPA: 6,7-dimethyl-8-ribityllumazine synthase, partial [Acidimicrobiales bacterium]|nr:6,7-dimethyl-8-ribityllumazine synthase [Acidimicrobiales bacterium]